MVLLLFTRQSSHLFTSFICWIAGFRELVEIWKDVEDLDGIIGAFCSVVCQPVSLAAAALNIPAVSPTCTSSALSDKRAYPTFTYVHSGLVSQIFITGAVFTSIPEAPRNLSASHIP